MKAALARMTTRALALLPPETAHDVALTALSHLGASGRSADHDPSLAIHVAGVRFPNPLALAAGFDKSARAVAALHALGFGAVEIGAVTPRPQSGNPKPRLFRLPRDKALINRFGFNNDGAAAIAARLARLGDGGAIGVNLGANKDSEDRPADFAGVYDALAPFVDYAVVNVSSPNTPGLRELQGVDAIGEIMMRLRKVRRAADPPVFLKLAPDLTDEDLADLADAFGGWDLAGLVLANTTTARPSTLQSAAAHEQGGLSGRPLKARALEMLRFFRKRLGSDAALMSVGGLETPDDAYERLRAGASIVQAYTAFIYSGPGWPRDVLTGLTERLKADGFQTVADAVGVETG